MIEKNNFNKNDIITSIKIAEILSKYQYDEKNTKFELEKEILDKKVNPFVIFSVGYIYDNLRDVEKYEKIVNDFLGFEINNIAKIVYLKRNGATKEYIKENIGTYFDFDILKEIEEIQLEKEYLDSFNNFKNFYNCLEEEKKYLFNKVMQDIEFYEKTEKINWLPTNNRKTPTYFADYGSIVEDLIKFIYSKRFIDYNFSKTIKSLKIEKFDENIEEYNILAIRAILTSILRRERYGSGSLPRYIQNGLIAKLLKKYEELLNS